MKRNIIPKPIFMIKYHTRFNHIKSIPAHEYYIQRLSFLDASKYALSIIQSLGIRKITQHRESFFHRYSTGEEYCEVRKYLYY